MSSLDMSCRDFMEEYQETREKKCPICKKTVRSDATIKISCALCGMGIPLPDQAVSYETLTGHKIYFCCDKCQAIYVKDLM